MSPFTTTRPKYSVIPVITVLIALKVPADIHVVHRHVKGPYFNHTWNVNKVNEVPKYETPYTSILCFLSCNM